MVTIIRKNQIEFIKGKITKNNMIHLLNTYLILFEYGVMFKFMYDGANKQNPTSISITYSTDLIHKKYAPDLIDIISRIYINIKHVGSYKMMGHHAIACFYSIT